MDKNRQKRDLRAKRHRRVRKKVHGTAARPRLCVFRSLKHIYAQLIDDERGFTLATASSLAAGDGGKASYGGSIPAAQAVGQQLAALAGEKNIDSAVFDRGGYKYHGRVKALADAVREGGLRF